MRIARKVKLTPLNIPTLPPGEHTDTLLRNLRLRVQPSGARSFCVVYRFNGRWRRFTIGTMPPLTLAEARQQGRQKLADVQKGIDPRAAKVEERCKSQTFAELVALYERKHGADMRRRSLAEFQRVCRVDILPAIGRLAPGPDMRPAIRACLGSATSSSRPHGPKLTRDYRETLDSSLDRCGRRRAMLLVSFGTSMSNGSRPLTPDDVHVWYTFTDQARGATRSAAYRALLCDAERARYARFRFAEDRHSFIVAHALLRTTLSRYAAISPGEWRFHTLVHGRPE
ncbi:MAG: integrase arm-type DNA-binding domain-containing protein, partial [Candidatus Acidiferrales bacterium]